MTMKMVIVICLMVICAMVGFGQTPTTAKEPTIMGTVQHFSSKTDDMASCNQHLMTAEVTKTTVRHYMIKTCWPTFIYACMGCQQPKSWKEAWVETWIVDTKLGKLIRQPDLPAKVIPYQEEKIEWPSFGKLVLDTGDGKSPSATTIRIIK